MEGEYKVQDLRLCLKKAKFQRLREIGEIGFVWGKNANFGKLTIFDQKNENFQFLENFHPSNKFSKNFKKKNSRDTSGLRQIFAIKAKICLIISLFPEVKANWLRPNYSIII